MNKEEQADEEEVLPAETEEEKKDREEAEAKTLSEQDPLKTELDKVQRKGRTKVEKLQYSKKRIDEQLKELGIEDESVDEDDEKPLTRGEFKKLQAQTATKTALDLADEVSSETERELLKYHLENTIRSTGNPQEDFKLALNLVNAVKNQQITEEVLRKPNVKTHGSGGGAPAKQEKQVEYTAEELSMMKPPWNLSKEQILEVRKKSEAK